MPVFVDKPGGGKVKVSFGIKGSINEHLASAWLMKNGYDVFKNVAPVGRADLVAKNWHTGELIFVDVKSESYDPDHCNGITEMSRRAARQAEKYKESNIKYLVVEDDGHCHWHGDAKSDPLPKNDKYWHDPRSGQRFLHPRNTMNQKQWSFFAHCMLKYYREELNQDQIDILFAVHRSTAGRGRHLSKAEIAAMPKLIMFMYQKIVLGIDEPANDNLAPDMGASSEVA